MCVGRCLPTANPTPTPTAKPTPTPTANPTPTPTANPNPNLCKSRKCSLTTEPALWSSEPALLVICDSGSREQYGPNSAPTCG